MKDSRKKSQNRLWWELRAIIGPPSSSTQSSTLRQIGPPIWQCALRRRQAMRFHLRSQIAHNSSPSNNSTNILECQMSIQRQYTMMGFIRAKIIMGFVCHNCFFSPHDRHLLQVGYTFCPPSPLFLSFLLPCVLPGRQTNTYDFVILVVYIPNIFLIYLELEFII